MNLPEWCYVYESCLQSFLGPERSCKVVDNFGNPTLTSCPAEFIQEFSLMHPANHLINSAIQSHHNSYGCGVNTVIAMFCFWYRACRRFQKEHPDVDTKIVVASLQECLNEVIDYLRENVVFIMESFHCKGKDRCTMETNPENQNSISDHIISAKVHDCSSSTVSKPDIYSHLAKFSRHMIPESSVSDCDHCLMEPIPSIDQTIRDSEIDAYDAVATFKKAVSALSHGQHELAAHLAEVWHCQYLQTNTNKPFFKHQLPWLNLTAMDTLPICGLPSASGVRNGFIFCTTARNVATVAGFPHKLWRVLMVNGSITLSFVHKGVNFGFEKCETQKLLQLDEHSDNDWLSRTTTSIKQLKVNLLLVTNNVDEKLQTSLNSIDIVVLTHVSTKTVNALSKLTGVAAVTYIVDSTEINIIGNIIMEPLTLKSVNQYETFAAKLGYLLIKIPGVNFQTVVLSHPVHRHAEYMEHMFWHLANRVRHASRTGYSLRGAGKTEHAIAQKLTESNSCTADTIEHYIKCILADGLLAFEFLVKNKIGLLNGYCISELQNKHSLEENIGEVLNTQLPYQNIILDDFTVKVESWKTALNLVCMVIQTDVAVIIKGLKSECNQFDDFVIGSL